MAKHCLYCEEEKFIQNGNEMVIFTNNYKTGQCFDFKTKKIKYCPMCGKKLEKFKCE